MFDGLVSRPDPGSVPPLLVVPCFLTENHRWPKTNQFIKKKKNIYGPIQLSNQISQCWCRKTEFKVTILVVTLGLVNWASSYDRFNLAVKKIYCIVQSKLLEILSFLLLESFFLYFKKQMILNKRNSNMNKSFCKNTQTKFC